MFLHKAGGADWLVSHSLEGYWLCGCAGKKIRDPSWLHRSLFSHRVTRDAILSAGVGKSAVESDVFVSVALSLRVVTISEGLYVNEIWRMTRCPRSWSCYEREWRDQ